MVRCLMGKRISVWTAVWLSLFCTSASASLLHDHVMLNDVQRGNAIGHPDSSRNVVVDSSGAIYVAFYGTNGIRMARSIDRGATFGTSILISNVNTECELAVDQYGALYLAWVENNGSIFFAHSTNHTSFSTPRIIGETESTVHLAADAPYLYVIPRGGGPLLRSTNNGADAFVPISVDTNRLFAEIIVNPRNHQVFVETDDPDIRYFKSTDYGATFGVTQVVGRKVYYPSVAGLFMETGNYLFIAGSSNNCIRLNADLNTSTNLSAGPTLEHGRSLATDSAGNLVDAFLTASGVYYRVSTNLGATFSSPVYVAGSVDAISAAINPIYGDVIIVYQDSGQIFSSVYASELICTNIDLRIESEALPACMRPGAEVSYLISITNMSSGTARGVVLSNQLPAQVTYLGGNASCSNHGAGLITCPIGEMLPFSGYDLTITGMVDSSASGSFSNRAEVTLDGRDIYPANNVSWARTCVSPVLSVVCDHSSCTPPAGLITNSYGAEQTNSAVSPYTVSSTQYLCTGWSMTGNSPDSGSTNTFSMTHTNDAVLTWIWGITNVQYAVTAGSHGSIIGASNGWYRQHTTVTAAPQSETHYHFTSWSGDVPSGQLYDNPLILLMDQTRNVTASFSLDQHSLAVACSHSTATPPSGVNTYAYNSSFTCQAVSPQTLSTAGTQYYCTGWAMTGNAPAAGSTNSFNMTLTNNAALTWIWGVTNVRLTATTDGHGTLSGQTSGWYRRNDSISITAVPGSFGHFTGWSGDISPAQTNQNPLTLTMDCTRTIQADFWIEQRTVDVVSAHGSPSPGVGSHAYDGLSTVSAVVATPVSGGSFTQYACTGWTMTGNAPTAGNTASFSMTLTNNAILTWTWKTNVYFTLTVSGPGSVSGGSSGWYSRGTSVTLTASAGNAYAHFIGWAGDIPAAMTNSNPLTVALTNARAVTALFYQDESTLLVTSPRGSPTPTAGTHTYARGTTLSSSAGSPSTQGTTQYLCTGWTMTGNAPTYGTNATFSMTLTNDAALTWYWGATNVYYSFSIQGSGSVTGNAAGWYPVNSTIQAVPCPVAGGRFIGWQLEVPEAQTNSNPLFLLLDRSRTIRALFTDVYRSLTVISTFGTPSPSIGTHSNLHGTSVSCSVATPVAGTTGVRYTCSGWSLSGNTPTAGTSASFSTIQTNTMTLTWNWKTNFQFTATAASNGSVVGSASGWYPEQTSVTVTAVPSIGYAFAGWQGTLNAGQTNQNPLILTLSSPHSVTARFTQACRTLTIQSTYGTPIPAEGVYTNEYGATLTNQLLNSTIEGASTSFVCIGWSMTGHTPVSGTGTVMTMMVTNNAVLTWNWATNVRLTCCVSGSGVVYGATNRWNRQDQTNIIAATPGSGMSFAGWSGDLPANQTNQNPLYLIMDQAHTVTAQFERACLTLEIQSAHGTGIPPAGIVTNLYGDVLTNTITETVSSSDGTQYVCTGWTMTGNAPASGTSNLLIMTVTNHAVLTWNWTTNVQLTWTTQGFGHVTGADTVWYPLGGAVTVTAVPGTNYQFDCWSGDVPADRTNSTAITLAMDRTRQIEAHFSLILLIDFMIAGLSVNSSVDRTSVDATILIQNIGTDTGDAGILTIWANRSTPANCGEFGDQSTSVGMLHAGETKSVVFTNLYPGSGTKLRSCRAFVDADCSTGEKEERNNQYAVNYSYLGPVLSTFTLTAIALTNDICLRWTAPTNCGMPNNKSRLVVNTNHYPTEVADGTKLTDGYTNIVYIHNNCTPGTPYYYTIWVNDGTYYIQPPPD